MNSPDAELWLSPISVWETIVLAEKGRIELNSDPQVWVKKYLRSLDFKEARITHEIVMKSQSIEPGWLTHLSQSYIFRRN